MRPDVDKRLLRGRVKKPPYDFFHDLNGAYVVSGPRASIMRIIAHDGVYEVDKDTPEYGWEHVSVSLKKRAPNWAEMCYVKRLFWLPEETVFQLHPPQSTWVNNHPFTLHMWRHITIPIPLPPSFLVGVAAEGVLRGPKHAEEVRAKYFGGDE